MQARYYDPIIGRFYSNDPVGWVANNPVYSFNRYSYANNNPYKYVDPDGRIVVYAGSTASGNGGLSGSGSSGLWLSVSSNGIEFGSYTSAEGGSAIGAPSAGAGYEFGAVDTSDWQAAMKGPYVTAGGEVGAAGSVTLEGTKTIPTSKGGESVNGVQVTVEASSPTAQVHQHNGVGTAVKIGGVTTQDVKNAGAAVSQAVDGAVDSVRNAMGDTKRHDDH